MHFQIHLIFASDLKLKYVNSTKLLGAFQPTLTSFGQFLLIKINLPRLLNYK
jgi:hypothetical protein